MEHEKCSFIFVYLVKGQSRDDDIVVAIALACWRAQRREVSGDAPVRPFNYLNMYNSVEDYDPVLRFHTRR
jgi:hypothetical protein